MDRDTIKADVSLSHLPSGAAKRKQIAQADSKQRECQASKETWVFIFECQSSWSMRFLVPCYKHYSSLGPEIVIFLTFSVAARPNRPSGPARAGPHSDLAHPLERRGRPGDALSTERRRS
ncbi:hypothetical protein SBA6_20013 [Candidatus Sulfopaludibacter sp. SbA6]|nr:hypothetical protein SBA6_20013 [Candidatus Sulfopaludibacter sp. SbA6]